MTEKPLSERPDHRIKKERAHDHTLALRNVLNIIFMIGAVIGAVLYFFTDHTTIGIYIVLGAMAVKMAECCIRMLR
ncbi:MAG: hypothetical protein IKX33_03295 [Prevotella sp.]|nr:hypothetical protein [Prevotella sp.]